MGRSTGDAHPTIVLSSAFLASALSLSKVEVKLAEHLTSPAP